MLDRRTATFGMMGAAGAMLASCKAGAAPYQQALGRGARWLNGAALQPPDLRGKVVLVNFWTFTCINSLRPLPYLRAWHEKYRERGLVVIGVHAPEFSFEHEPPLVERAVAEHALRYPVVIDNEFRIWRALDNSAWPAFYLIDANGGLRHRSVGEGDYDATERLIQRLLSESSKRLLDDPIVPVSGSGIEAAPDWKDLESPETYLGYGKIVGNSAASALHRNQAADYEQPTGLALNGWGLAGRWKANAECVEAVDMAALLFRFHARDLHCVMDPGAAGPIRFEVRIDGGAPGRDHGSDIDERGLGVVSEARLYQLVRQADAVRDRVFEIRFLDRGARAYAFTFG
jgi:thiol-disulfide isomerase/thioredoxin